MSNEKSFSLDTKDLFISAYMQLLKRDSSEKITVKQIISLAGLSRSTFYLHFQDKYDLINHISVYITAEFLDLFDKKFEKIDYEIPQFEKILYEYSLNMLVHIKQHKFFYQEQFNQHHFMENLSKKLGDKLYSLFQNADLSLFVTNGIVGSLGNWIFNDTTDEENIDKLASSLKNISIYIIQLMKENCNTLSINQILFIDKYNKTNSSK